MLACLLLKVPLLICFSAARNGYNRSHNAVRCPLCRSQRPATQLPWQGCHPYHPPAFSAVSTHTLFTVTDLRTTITYASVPGDLRSRLLQQFCLGACEQTQHLAGKATSLASNLSKRGKQPPSSQCQCADCILHNPSLPISCCIRQAGQQPPSRCSLSDTSQALQPAWANPLQLDSPNIPLPAFMQQQ